MWHWPLLSPCTCALLHAHLHVAIHTPTWACTCTTQNIQKKSWSPKSLGRKQDHLWQGREDGETDQILILLWSGVGSPGRPLQNHRENFQYLLHKKRYIWGDKCYPDLNSIQHTGIKTIYCYYHRCWGSIFSLGIAGDIKLQLRCSLFRDILVLTK